MDEPVFRGRGLSLQAALVMDSSLGSKVPIGSDKVQGFHPDDRNTMMVTAVYYLKEEAARTMLENGADLAFRNFEACKFAISKALDTPKDARAVEMLRLVSDYAERQGIDLGEIRKQVEEQRNRDALHSRNAAIEATPHEPHTSSKVLRQRARTLH